MSLPRTALPTGYFLCCLLGTLLCSAQASADELWQLHANDVVAVDGFLPSNAVNAVPVRLSRQAATGLAADLVFTVTLPDGAALDYRVEALTAFANGDTGVRAVLVQNPDAGNYLISMTTGRDVLMASIYVPGAKYLLQAQRVGDNYLGYLYQESPALRKLPADAGSDITLSQADAIGNSDVTITQTFSDASPLVGDAVNATIALTNNSGSSIIGQVLKVHFILDASEFLDANAGCTAKNQVYSNGTFKELHCPVSDLAPGATLNITYSIRITADSIPYMLSTVILDKARHDEFLYTFNDTLKDTDGDGISDFNEGLLGTNPASAGSGPAEGATATVDLLILYTPRYVSDSSPTNPLTAINQHLQETNDIYAASATGIQFRAVMYNQVNYLQQGDLGKDLDAMENKTGGLQNIEYLRAISGADLVVLMHGRNGDDDACGIAQGSRDGSLGDYSWVQSRGIYTTLYKPGPDATNTGSCGTDTLAHELGHLFGLDHSHAQGSTGTFNFSVGYGVNNSFHTIMAYSSAFPNSDSLPVFSNPANTSCKGQPCGISENDAQNGANAVLSLRTTRFQLARFHDTRPTLPMLTATGAATAATAYGGVIRTGGSTGYDTVFGSSYANTDELNLTAVINVDPAHVGQVGVTYVVLAAEGLGYFQMNTAGGIVPWDGNASTLQARIAPRALQSEETLEVFRGLAFNAVGVPAINLTVFFAYGLQSTGTLVYTSSGVPLQVH